MFAQDVFERLGLSQDTDLLNDLQKEALLEPTEAAQSPYMDDPAYAGFETLRGLFGSNHGDNPSMYWLAQGKEMPEFATVADAQAAVWKDFQKKARAYQEEQERQQQAREALAATIDPFIDRYVRGDAVVPSPEQVMMMQEAGISWESVRRARRGMQLVREYDTQGILYDDRIINNLAEQVGDDELARRIVLNMFYNDARKYAKDKHGDEWTGIDWIDKAAQGVTGMVRTGGVKGWRTGQKAWRNLQVMGEVDAVTNAAKRLPELIASGMDVDEARAQIEKDATFLEIRRRWAADLVQTMEAGEKEYLEGEDRHLVGRIGSQLGSIIGDTAPWFIPAIGPAIGASSAMQSRRDEGVSIGLTMEETEKRAMMFGQADALEEMIAFSPIGRLTPGYKWLKKALGGGKAAGKLAPWRARWMASPKAQYAIQGLSGAAEESILEPTAGYLMRTVQSMNLTDERGKQTFRQYLDDMGQMMHGEQGLALLAFTFGMSGFNYPQIKKAAQEFGLSLQHYKELGGTAQGYLEAREEKTAEGFLNKALANLHDSWMEDPQASLERASAAAGERLSGERIESLRELDAWRAAEDAGMVPRVEPAEQEGMFRVYAPARSTKAPREDASVSREGEEEDAPSYTLMDGEQMTAYLQAFVSEQVESDILYTQHLLAGDVTVRQALAQGRFDAAEVITRTVTDEKTGAERVVIAPETLGQMKARADMAMAAIRALEAEGVSYEDAADRMDASLSEHLPLGTLVKTWEEAQERIRTEQARNPEFKVPAMDAPFSNAYVTKVRRGDTFRRVLRYARGNATVEDLMEETMEQAVISWQAEQGLTWGEFGAMLQEAQRVMNELFPEARGEEMQFIHLDAGKPVTGHDAIEAFSKIGRSRWLADAVNHPSLPSWLRKLLNHLVKFLGAFKARVELGEMVRQAEEQGVFTLPVRQALAVMLDAGNALYRDQQGDLMELSMERARAQAELDAMFGAGVATEARTLEDELAESRKEDEERRKEAEDEARAPENSPEAQEARREREQARVEALGEPDGSGVFNGAFIEVQEGVRLGFIDKNKLTLCPDVPQFKQGADEQTGVVNPIVGAWQRNAAPISVWRREDGSLQVISGRHRFNACTDEDINCTVYDEAAGFDLDWAQTHDVENNIRDGQASLFEIARYVSQKGLTKEEAVERGIFRKGQSRRGVELGMYGCSDLLDALGNELVSPDDAWRVAMAFRNQTEVQRAGLRALMEGKSWQQAFAVMQVAANMDRIRGLAEAAGMTFETDLFGNSHAEEYFARLAQYAAARVSELTREISSISGASRRPETARKYGVDVRDAGALEAVVKDLKAQRARWQNFGLHEDLIKEANDAVMVELGVKTREEVDRENGVLPLEAPEQEAVSADTGMLQLSQDVSRMLDAALARGAAPAEDEAPAANFSLVSIPSGEVITTAAEMRARLKPLQGKVFVNKNTGIQAVIEARVSGKTVGKAGAAQMSVANLKALGFSAEEARRVHYTAAARIHELFENAEDGFFEEAYKQDSSKAGAYHFFNTVDIGGIGAFDVNVTAIKYVKEQEGNVLYTLELTIENPAARGAASREGRLPTPFKDGVSTRNLSSYRSFVEKEKAAVRKKAVADGTFMKAPNGANTNLTEDQWLAVRTAAFKNWFGDWEHDPQNASKVVDENGEPRVVYHGSHQWFTSFNDGKQRQQSGAPAGTIFANDNREIAVSFADYYGGHADEVILDPNDERHPRYSWGIYREGGIYDLFMNVRNPLVVDFEGRPWLDSSKGGDINALCSKAKESGHDGVIALNIVDVGLNDQENVPASTDYVAFDSVQVKSAAQNRGTYDPKNPDITFSIVSAQEQGLFRDGHFEAGNAVITEPGVTFSIAALHASPHSFRKFDTAFMGKGEGAQAYGWGLYFAENPEVNRSYMNQFAQDKATWKFREVETGVIEVMQRSLVGSFLPKDALPEAKEDASDIAWSVLGDLVDAARGSMTVLDIVMELHDEIDTNRKYAETYPQEREKLEQLEGFMLSLLDHLDEIEVRTGMPSNYRVELNVEDSELMGWDYVDETVLALLKDSPVEEVRYALERAERRADYRGENVSGKDVYQELFDAFWDGEDGTKQEAQKAASVSLLSSDIKGIKYADGYTRNKAEEEQTYNYVIFDGNDIKITAFADESTGGAWADYEDPTATFSIIGEKAESFQEYHNNGLSYTDPADGKRKAIIDSRGVRLRKEHVSVSEGGHVNVSLAAALDFPELFRAYPELRKLRVDFYRDSRSGTGGFTDPQEHYIAVNVARGGKNAAPGMVLDTILHEVQHVIQGYEGFAVGAGNMSREQALAYLGESMSQLAGRDDAWAKEALPRLERMRQELETGTLQPAFVYVFSHGEQEARLAGSFEKNSEGVVMSGLNGFRLLDAPPFSIPLTGDITELGGITFGAGRFGRMAGRVLAPNGDWLYDEMVFRMRAAAQRSVSKLRLFETGDRERGLELLAEAQELISTVERFLPHTYGFGLEPYKIWLNVFSLLYGNSGKMAPGDAVASALEAIPMKRWPEIMEGSIGKSFVNWAEKRPELEDVVEEARREIAERQADYELDSAPDADNRAALAARKGVEQEVWRRLFEEHGAEFLEEYGEQKVFRLVGKFMARVVEQIDRFRKDRTLGRIRRVAASVAPRTNPQGKPLRGKMDAESYRRLEDRLRLMEMTPAQYDAFFRKNFPEVLDEEAAGQQEGRTLWEDVKPQDMVTVETTDAEGGALALTVTKATFEAYACYEKMSVETAENAARALGEFIATRREAWENAAESKKNEIEDLLRPVLEAAGRTDDQAMATHRKQARLKTLPSGPMSLTGYLLNFSQYMQGLQSVPAFRGIAKKFERRAARFAVQKQACEKDTLAFVKKAAGRILQTEDEYEIADWIYEQRGGLDTGLTITEQEPDWQGKAREEYRAGVLNLIRRKVRKRGAARTLAHVAFLMKDMDAELKAEIERIWPDARDEVWSEKDAAVFTEKELDRYGSQEKYVEEHAARARKASKWGKGKSPYQAQSYKLDHISRMEAAYIILLSQQEDYQEMLRLKGFTQEILEGLEQFAGSEVMEFSRALREKLNERGQEVKEVTESRYGAPFPLIENYFRAFFDVGIEAIDQSIMDAASYGDAATGGKFGLIHARKKHHASLDLSIDVLTAYYAAMNEQDVYLYGSEISRDMRALINYRGENGTRGARVLEKVIGRDALNKLLVWCDSFDKGMAGNVRGFLEMQKSLNRISSAAAITLLPGRVGTWLKQSTALINAAFSSDEIDPHEWAASMARMAAGKLALSPRELMKRAALDARDATETAVIREAMSADEAGRAASGAWKRLNVKGMNLLTQTDVGLNAVSSAILYDAVYRKEMKRNPGLSREEADRRAMMEVELSLSRKAQPMTPQQRSLAAQTRSVWNVGMLFLGGESINTFAETVALWKQGGMKNKAKSVSMFYAHGLLLASMSAMLNFFTDDERRRKRREWWHIFIDALQGPLQGIPFWGALAGGAVRGMSSLCGYRYYEATTSLVPFASWDNLERAGKDLAKLFDGKDKDWVDFPLAFMGALRMAAFGAALGGASTPKGARFKAAAFSAAAFVNLTEFLLRAMKGLPLRLEGK
nr:MAG TPA: PolyVal ADP-Ribosyltransferase [Caudoviricetes sp.]